MSKVCCLYHIVINTYKRKMVIPEEHKSELYRYIAGIIEGHKSQPIRINGIGNHIHILLDLHPSVALAGIVQSIKMGSNKWITNNPKFPDFEHWGKEYFAFSVSSTACDNVKNYIINQERHHIKKSFEDELKDITSLANMEWMDYLLT